MTQWMHLLLRHSLAMAAVVLVYHAAAVLLRRRYAARWFYLVGMLLLAGFLIPFRPVLTVAALKAPAFLSEAIHQAAQPMAADPIMDTGTGALSTRLWAALGMGWAIGATGTLLLYGIRHIRFVRGVRRWCTQVRDPQLLAQFESAKEALSLRGRDIGLAHCACIRSPMLLWLHKPMVLLPEGAAAYDVRLILRHELIHLRRHDLLGRVLMLLATAMHWFNPAIYLLVRLVTLQCEISCDDMAVKGQDMEGRHRYAMSIIDAARCRSGGNTLLTTYFYGGKNTMKKRIASVYEPQKTKMGVLLLVCALLMTLLAGTTLAVEGEAAVDFTLPEAAIQSGEALDSYVVSWPAIEGAKAYRIGLYMQVKNADGEAYYHVAEGYIGSGMVEDGAGTVYGVDDAVWQSIELEGTATEVDLAKLINTHLTFGSESSALVDLLSCTMTMVVAMEDGAPIKLDISLPVA